MSLSNDQIVEAIATKTLMEVMELVRAIEEKFGVSAAAPVAAAMAGPVEIRVPDIAPLLATLAAHGIALHLPPEDRWYRRDSLETGNRQFIVADPDGYLLRFYQDLGLRPCSTA